MPVIGARHGIARPARFFGVAENDARAGVGLVVVGPDVVVARGAAGTGTAGALEPRVLVGRMVDDEFGDHPQSAGMCRADERACTRDGAVVRMYAPVVCDVVAIVAARRRIEGQE